MTSPYRLKLMFEWRGGCLWCDNEAACKRFDVGPIEEDLPLTQATLEQLVELTTWHDQSLNWDYPPDPGPWSPEEYKKFEFAALAILKVIQQELGPNFEVVYVPLG